MCSRGTVINVKKRYREGGLEAALYDKPRPGTKPKITGEVEAHLIALVCSDPPEGQPNFLNHVPYSPHKCISIPHRH